MSISQDEANEMYARFLIARNGITAEKIAKEKAKALQQQGDLNGHKVWNAVADRIDRLQRANKFPVGTRALVKRINRQLRSQHKLLRATRPQHRSFVGSHYVWDYRRNAIVEQHVDIEAYARALGVLADCECLARPSLQKAARPKQQGRAAEGVAARLVVTEVAP